MTYVDDDDFDDIEEDMEDGLEKGEIGRCEECGFNVKKDDAVKCPLCSALYHEWCVNECLRCKTPLK